jgi:hypothetical protein
MNNDVTIERGMRTGPCRGILAVFQGMFICMVLLQASPVAAEEAPATAPTSTMSAQTATLLAPTPTAAAPEAFPDRFMLRLGGYRAENANTIMRLDANSAPVGAYIDFKQTLGGESSTTVARMDGLYRFNDKHALGLSWYTLKFKGSRFLSQEIKWGDQTFAKDTQVDSEIKFDIYKLNYQYSLFHNEKAELGALFGLHIMRAFAGISASGIVQSQGQAITAPLPVFGLFADYNFTPRFSAFYNYQWFFINYEDKVKGGLQDFLIGLEYRLFRHVALGAAYNRFALNMDLRGDAATLILNTSWNGGMLYGSLYF